MYLHLVFTIPLQGPTTRDDVHGDDDDDGRDGDVVGGVWPKVRLPGGLPPRCCRPRPHGGGPPRTPGKDRGREGPPLL